MPLDFPANPTNGQTYDNYFYDASISSWRSSGTKAGLTPRVVALETYPSGLVPVIPTSVSVGSGSASVSGTGLVTFTGASNLILNGVFSSLYKNYKVLVDFTNSVIGEVNYSRVSSGGTVNTGTYRVRGYQQTSNTTPTNWGFDATAWTFGRGAGDAAISMDIFDPATTKRTRMNMQMFGYVSNEAAWGISGGLDNFLQFDGYNIYPNSGTITGTIQVYGYRN